MAVEIKVHVEDTVRSLDRFAENWRVNSRQAVKKTFKLLMRGVVKETLKYRDPHPLYYIRTLRLVNGWQKAANEVGVEIPGPRPHAQIGASDSGLEIVDTNEEITYRGINRVPYAIFVEDTGTPIAKEQGGGRRPPYKNVFTPTETLRENQALEIITAEAWNSTKAD